MVKDDKREGCKRTHYLQRLPTLTYSKTSCRICIPVISSSKTLFVSETGYSTISKDFNDVLKLLKKGNKQLTLGRIILKETRSRLAPEVEVNI